MKIVPGRVNGKEAQKKPYLLLISHWMGSDTIMQKPPGKETPAAISKQGVHATDMILLILHSPF